MGENLGMAPFSWVVWSGEGGGNLWVFFTGNSEKFENMMGKFHQALKSTKLAELGNIIFLLQIWKIMTKMWK